MYHSGSISFNIITNEPKPKKIIRRAYNFSSIPWKVPPQKPKEWMPILYSLDTTPLQVHTENAKALKPINNIAKKQCIPPSLPLSSLSSFLSSQISTCQKFLNTTFSNILDHPIPSSVDPNHVFTGNFAPVNELGSSECPVIEGELPISLTGVYIRNGSNPQYKNNGPQLLFEGDGMLHSLLLSKGHATFCSRYVKTYKYMLEREAGFPMFPNFLSGLYGPKHVVHLFIAIGRVMVGHINIMRGFGLANTNVSFFHISSLLLASLICHMLLV